MQYFFTFCEVYEQHNLPPTFGVVVPKVEGVVEPVADTGLGDVGLFGEVEENADVVLKEDKHETNLHNNKCISNELNPSEIHV